MAEVKVLVEGMHKMDEDGKLFISSTCTLIKTDKNILVDTSSFHKKKNFLLLLKKKA